MKRNISIWLALSIVVALVVFSLVFVKAASVNQTDVSAYSGKSFDGAEVGASVPPEYHYDPIESIYIRDAGTENRLFEGESVKMTKVSNKLYQYTFKDLTPNKRNKFQFCVNDKMIDRFAMGQNQTDYGFDYDIPVFRYPPSNDYTPPLNELNLVERTKHRSITAGRVFV